ncbi:MAG: hypothetical protein WCW46_03410 [Candidatus Paceibacterota bacterium]
MSMRGIKKKEEGNWKKWVSFLFFLFLLVVLVNSVRGVYQKKKSAEEILVRMEKETSDLKNRDQYLKASIERMATKEGLEFEMRKKLNVAQAGEGVAIIVENGDSSTTTDTQISAWQKFKNFWIGIFR